MLTRAKGWASLIAVLALAGVGAVELATSLGHATDRQALKSNDLTGLRAQALNMFPRGSRLDEAEAHLAQIGFSCEAIPHSLPDISGPSLRCASNGRGYPDYPAINIVLLSRNGLVSDVDVWNIMARADGRPDDIDFTAIGASDALSPRLRRPERADDPDLADSDAAVPKT